jgi:hypothetical protein
MKSTEDRLIDVGIEVGDDIFFQLLDDHPQLDKNDPRQDAMIYRIMYNCVVRLHLLGWSEVQLMRNVLDAIEVAKDIDSDGED